MTLPALLTQPYQPSPVSSAQELRVCQLPPQLAPYLLVLRVVEGDCPICSQLLVGEDCYQQQQQCKRNIAMMHDASTNEHSLAAKANAKKHVHLIA